MLNKFKILCVVLVFMLTACKGSDSPSKSSSNEPPTVPPVEGTFTLSSTSFTNDGTIPVKYSCDGVGGGTSPKFSWLNPPAGTKYYALIMDDSAHSVSSPYSHWGLFNLPKETIVIEEGYMKKAGEFEGKNYSGAVGYGSPCPPSGQNHPYITTIYALDALIAVTTDKQYKRVVFEAGAYKNNILGKASYRGTFSK